MKNISFASTSKIKQFQSEVDTVILAIAPFMIDPDEDPQEWAAYVFVSDESSIGDFLSDESALPSLSQSLHVPLLKSQDLVSDVAEFLHQRERPH